ncbi:MarR family winged helix-turn-helix transcriptional regulator [Paenibacillus kandeliae]|uniref:MarR family winged helix-turn-helix transcriptional regulator n=1 Tax=Paenibacillus kandeliae TaxID=3231269 RepID=UPI00345A0737
MQGSTLFRQLINFITSVHNATAAMSSEIRLDHVTPIQYKILEYLAVSQPQTPSAISDCMHMSMPNTSRELRKLIEKGLCEKLSDPNDRRKQLFRLTAVGTEWINGIFAQIEVKFNERTKGLDAQERQELEQALQLLQRKVFY